MNNQEIKAFLDLLPFTDAFDGYAPEIQDKIIFSATSMLRRRYGSELLTAEMVALQALYIAEGEKEQFAKFQRQNVTNMRVEDISFTFGQTSGISPEVVAIVENQAQSYGPLFGGAI